MHNDPTEESDFPLTPEQADDLWREGLERGSRISFRVASGSMYPTLAEGDRVVVECFPESESPKVGDIVLLRIDGLWVVHRLVGKKRSGGQLFYRQKGDAEYRSTLSPASTVAGRIVTLKNGTGSISLQTPWQRIIRRAVGLILCAMDSISRSGIGAGGGESGKTERVSWWRTKAAAGFGKSRVVLIRTGSRLMRLGSL